MINVTIRTDFIKLDAMLKYANAVESGGMAKTLIQDEQVKVNGEKVTKLVNATLGRLNTSTIDIIVEFFTISIISSRVISFPSRAYFTPLEW